MNINSTLKIVVFALICLMSFNQLSAQTNYGSIRGKITDENDKPVSGAIVELVSSESPNEIIESKKTEVNGYYNFINLTPGKYFVKIRKESFSDQTSDELTVVANEEANGTIKIYPLTYTLKGITKTSDNKKLQNTQVSTTQSSKTLTNTGQRGFTSLAGLAAGVSSGPSGLSGRGSRANGTVVFVDGVRVQNTSLAQSSGAQVDILQAGIPAMYGDFTGLGVSITTKGGVSARKGLSFDYLTSSVFNPYHFNLFEVSYFTPILFRNNPDFDPNDKQSIRKIPVAAMFLAGNFTYQKDAPSFVKYTVVKEDVLNELEKNPLVVNKDGGLVHAANYLTEDDFERVKVRPNTLEYQVLPKQNLTLD